MNQFLSIDDVPDPAGLVKEALVIKTDPFAFSHLGKNKTLGLVFLNPSLRTRMSTQRAAQNLGMDVMVLNVDKDGWQLEFEDGAIMNGASQEHIKEAAAVISQYCDIIGIRTFPSLQDREADYNEKILRSFARNATVPVISLESATLHPLQSLADWLTIEEHKTKDMPKVVLTWAPHPKALPQSVPNSFVQWIRKAPVEFVITHPEGYELNSRFTAGVTIEYDQNKALAGADFVYAKNWSSYNEYGKILSQDSSWMVTEEKMALTNQGSFMHCLPVRRNVIVTDQVLDGPNSLIINEAGNRVYAAQAVLKSILENGASGSN
ncbi:MAG: N-acetylornithine carbamoyltransferase [Cyclobacteriaceae bacterium]|nr:N-acetylornithine carbamoyltransferase [Cyclobacteriaceae bacterium]